MISNFLFRQTPNITSDTRNTLIELGYYSPFNITSPSTSLTSP
ncbi:14533_t:CDS:2 [Acaulospora morrowiae]|uniref:14533_t:CDS:1 n=1 Tax=Acaulospora morrowiae TaxID=94023 RepID=A0A9N9FT69_9GLOM|nr:14533_t:CDS:2 [Acaulospora morrowiae]